VLLPPYSKYKYIYVILYFCKHNLIVPSDYGTVSQKHPGIWLFIQAILLVALKLMTYSDV